MPVCLAGPGVCSPEQLPVADLRSAAGDVPVYAVGSGAAFADQFPGGLDLVVSDALTAVLPHARDLLPLAQVALDGGDVQAPEQIAPTYVQERIGWKKLSEQGKQQ
jgi:tRNA A37 threonylcarbamoyladenosine modification protein TsaB